MVLTEARLEQGVREIEKPLERRYTGEFVKWVQADVRKETKDELEVPYGNALSEVLFHFGARGFQTRDLRANTINLRKCR